MPVSGREVPTSIPYDAGLWSVDPLGVKCLGRECVKSQLEEQEHAGRARECTQVIRCCGGRRT